MAERQVRHNRKSRSSCPDGWMPAGYVVPLRLTVRQERYCRRAIGISRFIYNLCVATHRLCRASRMPWPSWQDLYKAFNGCKREDYPFVMQVASRVQEGAFKDFGAAVRNWRDPSHPAGPPRFRKRRRTGTGAFRAASGVAQLRYDGKRRIRLPVIGSVKLAHTLPAGIPYEAHISYRNGRWVLSVKYWREPTAQPDPDNRIAAGAVDTGISPMATDSEGQVWENPKAYYRAERKLRRWQRAQARRTPGSRGWWEAQRRIDRLQRRVTGLRRNAQHQMTSTLVNKFRSLVIEDLNVKGMMSGWTPKAQADAGMGEIRRQLIYKGKWRHCRVLLADRYYPSSKTCSVCGVVNAKLKRERRWRCGSCGTTHERNLNAAVNLRNLLTLPSGRGVTLRKQQLRTAQDGKALVVASNHYETGPDDRRTAPLKQVFNNADCVLAGCLILNVNTP